jgi:4-hydroxybenzoate polyprenyltransferase
MIGALLETLRPRQWTKNLLVFAGLLFSQQFGEPGLVLRAVAGFFAFCLLSGSVYLLNDLTDAEADRQHPRKRLRPIPSGRLPGSAAIAALPVLIATVFAIAWWLGAPFAGVAALYLALNLGYTFGLKRQVILDVFIIALGFVLRALAGVELLRPVSPATEISPWLLVCTFFGALFLALAKRRREIANAGSGVAATQREVLSSYPPQLLDGMLLVSAAASLMGYALYTIWPATVAKFHTQALLYTVPIVAYGIFRYLYLVQVSEASEDPSAVLLGDTPIRTTVALYLAAVVFILYGRP